MGEFVPSFKVVFYCLSVVIYFQLINHLSKTDRRNTPISEEEHLHRLARMRGTSEYALFFVAAENWQVSKLQVEEDFKQYLQYDQMPYYVKDYLRKHDRSALPDTNQPF